MNELLLVWLFALSPPKVQSMPPNQVNGVSEPFTPKSVPSSFVPALSLTSRTPNQYSSTSLVRSLCGLPYRDRQRALTVGSVHGSAPPCGSKRWFCTYAVDARWPV